MIEQTQTSTWQSKIKALGPGILMASAAVGGSHIVSSAQAGAMYGWSLLLLVILANLFKYPFFRFGAEYTLETGKNLVEGYAEKGKVYLGIFFILNVFSALVNTAAVGILCAAIVASAFPNALGLSITQWSLILIVLIWAMLLFGGYKFLDGLAKWIMSALTLATVLAVIVAIIEHPEYGADFVEKTPWQMTALPFIVSLMGWMPAPIEISAINSLWTAEKGKTVDIFLITLIAFLCIFGTVITVIDGYSRVNAESLRLLFKKKEISQKELNIWMTATSIIGGIIIYFFQGSVAPMLRFAMIASFLTTPFFALLNYLLVTGENKNLAKWLKALSILGLIFLFGFAFFFIYALVIGKAY